MSDLATVLAGLESLDLAGLQEVARRADELLKERERGRQREAIEQARAILAGAGLSVHDLIANGTRPGGTGRATRSRKPNGGGRAGTRYANPADPSQIYEPGRGRAPRWYGELKARGELPDPLP